MYPTMYLLCLSAAMLCDLHALQLVHFLEFLHLLPEYGPGHSCSCVYRKLDCNQETKKLDRSGYVLLI